MKDTLRLTFVRNMTDEALSELWENCFVGQENLDHMNAHVPIPIAQQWQLNDFLIAQNSYEVWLIKRKAEEDIIGFVIHGDFFPGFPNNIGFNIGLNYTRNGFATETLKEVVEQVIGIGLSETFGHCFETNHASIRTMENCGFQNMGRTGQQFNDTYVLKLRKQL
jgi:RimJ/RimL family protein N-acetyltransferase